LLPLSPPVACLRSLARSTSGRADPLSDLILVWSRILVSIGGGCSVISSQVAVQASVPHQDMAIASANLALWTQVGGSIGSAIAAAIWTNKLPYYLTQNLGDTLNSTQIEDIYSSIVTARLAEPRDKVIDGEWKCAVSFGVLGLLWFLWLHAVRSLLVEHIPCSRELSPGCKSHLDHVELVFRPARSFLLANESFHRPWLNSRTWHPDFDLSSLTPPILQMSSPTYGMRSA
jgi:hypothetical protein